MKAGAAVLLIILAAVALLPFASFACEPISTGRLIDEKSIAAGTTVKSFILPSGVTETVFYIEDNAVYRLWQERDEWKAAVKTDSGWLEGAPLWGYALLEEGNIVFFLLTEEGVEKFIFPLPCPRHPQPAL